MNASRPRRRGWTGLWVVVLLASAGLAACGPSFRRAQETTTPTTTGETAEVGSGVERHTSSASPERGSARTVDTTAPVGTGAKGSRATSTTSAPVAAVEGQGRAVLTVRDPRGFGRSGIPVLLSGPVTMRLRSGAGGRLEVHAPPGRYKIAVEVGCTEDLEIRRGATGELGLVDGDPTSGELSVDAGLRYRPAKGAYWRDGQPRSAGRADWRYGEVHVVEMALVDACATGSSPFAAEGAALGRMRFLPGEGLEMVDPPPAKAGPQGRVQIRLRCTGKDVDVALDLLDEEVPVDRTPVFGPGVFEDQSTPFCTSP